MMQQKVMNSASLGDQNFKLKFKCTVKRRRSLDEFTLAATAASSTPSVIRCNSIRRKRSRMHGMAQLPIIYCFLISAAAKDHSNECTAPQVLKFKRFQLKSNFSPRETAQLGDGRRSSEATGHFFDSLDRDGDGSLGSEEVALFLRDQIGGSQFDSQSAVDDEVVTVIEKLDQNHNNGLEMSDVLDYWMQLESLLTAEEVRDWIVYAVQLPKSVGQIFLENGITGYDFLEIIENGGNVLRDELGVEKSSFINKIVKHIQARMLGIGSIPESPKNFSYKLESCKTVSFSWSKCKARVFPVHSYRIQRRAINLFEHAPTSTRSHPGTDLDMSLSMHVEPLPSDWKTVYVGGENEFVDSLLETGHNYLYRIQAWNSVGRSSWEMIDLSRQLKKQRCSMKPSHKALLDSHAQSQRNQHDGYDHWELLAIPKRLAWGIVLVVQFFFTFVRGFFAVIAMGTAIMRYRRASATSTASATTILPFPWFWKGINNLSAKLTGHEIIPRTMLGDVEALMIQEQLHDDHVCATGLRGYNRLVKKKSHLNLKDDKRGMTVDAGNGQEIYDKRASIRNRSHSAGNMTSILEDSKSKADRSLHPVSSSLLMRKKDNRIFDKTSSSSIGTDDNDSYGASISKSDHPRIRPEIDDDSRCVVCEKKFKFGKRWKHHCSRCMSTFCHKHGRTTHNNFTSCKVPGSCVCNHCLNLTRARENSSKRKH